MRRSRRPAVLALLAALALGVAAPASAQAVLAGRVVDALRGTGLPGVHVFLAGTMQGTTTDAMGAFELRGVPTGTHRVVASMMGFEPHLEPVQLAAADTLELEIALAEAVVELGGVTVEARSRRRARDLRRFELMFVGETQNAEQTRILNPEVLEFSGSAWGTFEARAREPLIVENRALGYRLLYVLDEFALEDGTLRYDGEPLFAPLPPADSAEAAGWDAARRRAYRGSLRHFLRTLADGTTREAGFRTYRRMGRSGSHLSRFPLDPAGLAARSDTAAYLLDFEGLVEVVYEPEPPDPGFSRWVRRDPHVQWSWLELAAPTAVDARGVPADAFAIVAYGHMGFERVADELPKEYRE